ncbi:MAG: hypothetical protein L3V56_08935 [Candidatus Magnetoovum sp. WYHC-5]|nr:hypothetical protein [Candidatus Magnetoovum sp. WYHC-5]
MLKNKQKTALWIYITLVVGIVGLLFIFGELKDAQKKYTSAKDRLYEFNTLLKDYEQLNAKVISIEKKIESTNALSALKVIEDIFSSVGLKDRLASIKPGIKKTHSKMLEENFEIKLDNADLNEIVNFLYKIENGNDSLIIRRFSMKKIFSDPSRFSITIDIAYVKKGDY